MRIIKSFSIILVLLLLMVTPAFAFNDVSELFVQYDGADKQVLSDTFGPMLDSFTLSMNSGLYFAAYNDGIFGVGFLTNMDLTNKLGIQSITEQQFYKDVTNTDLYVFPSLYANVDIQVIDLVIFARGFLMPAEGDELWGYIGGGVSYTVLDLWIIKLRAIGAVHYLSGPQFVDVITSSVNAAIDFTIPIPVILLSVYANAGWELGYLGTDLIRDDDGDKFTLVRNAGRTSFGLMVGFEWIALGYEYSTLYGEPADGAKSSIVQNHAISLGIYF